MDYKIQAWLSDIQTGINEIFEFIGDQPDFDVYRQDLKTKRQLREIWKSSGKR